MMKMYKNIKKKIISYDYLAYGVLILALVIIQNFVVYAADDVSVQEMLNGETILGATYQRYISWEGSWFCQFIIFLITKNIWSFKILNILMCILLVYVFSAILPEAKFKQVWAVILFLSFPMGSVTTAGVIVTGIAYLWVAACLSYAIFLVLKVFKNEKFSTREYCAGILAVLLGTNREQTVLFYLFFIACVSVIFGVKGMEMKEKFFVWISIGVAALNFFTVMFAPGLSKKKIQTIAKKYPDFESISLGDKLYQGLSETLNYFLAQKHLVILIFCILLMVMAWKKYQSLGLRIIAIYPFTYIMCVWIQPWRRFDVLFRKSVDITSQNVICLSDYVPFIMQILWLGCVVATIWMIFENSTCFWVILSALSAGMIITVALGFTGSLYASGSRINVFFYMIIIAVTMILLYREKSIMENSALMLLFGGYSCFTVANYVLSLIEYGGFIPSWILNY